MTLIKNSPLRRVTSDKNIGKIKLTQVDGNIFKQMTTNEGLSVAQMNDLGVKVVLFFSSSLGTIDDIYALKDEFTKLNAVPVVCHNESNEVWEEFVNYGERNKKFKELLHLDRRKFNSEFKLEKTVFSLIKETLGSGINELKRLKNNGIKSKMSWWTDENKNTLAAVFVVADRKIIYEYKKPERSERFDLAKIIIDPTKEGIEVNTTYYLCDYLKKKKTSRPSSRKNSMDSLPSLSGMYERRGSKEDLSPLAQKFIESQNVVLRDVLENDQYREYFKVYTMSKMCVENMLFYEEVLKYKKSDKDKRKGLGEAIIGQFFEQGSCYELNTNEKEKENAKKLVSNGAEEAFEQVVGELTNSVLLGMFKDFKNSSLYIDMLLQKKIE